MDQGLSSIVTAALEALGGAGKKHGIVAGEQPRYELFHAANSICSQKVRAILAHHRMPHREHALNMFLGDTYLPGYVRLRMVGCEHYGGPLASHHSGSTSTAAGGCDAAVVPTMIDWETDEVIVDSRGICVYLDAQVPDEHKLRPPRLEAGIDDDLKIIDNLPNYQMLMGRTVVKAEAAGKQNDLGASFSERKVTWCDRYLQECASDPNLVAAYTAKRAKELSAASELFSPKAIESAYGRAENAVLDLERRLGRRSSRWLHGEDLTMADLFWGIELLRMKNTGFARFWKNKCLANVERFSIATERIPAIRRAIIDWPGAIF